MPLGSIGELASEVVWNALNAWLGWPYLGRSWLWFLVTALSASAMRAFSSGHFGFGFVFAIPAMFLLVPAVRSED